MRVLLLLVTTTGCAYISDKHEEWRMDPDEDGTTIVDDCDDRDDAVGAPSAWYVDKDEDGFGDSDDVTFRCVQPDGHVALDGDCDDTDRSVYPGAEEVCDGADNNCNGTTDEDLALAPWYADADGDGFGDPLDAIDACGSTNGRVDNDLDCDDSDATWQVRAEEEVPYNGIDDNCDPSDGDGDRDLDGYWASNYYDLVIASGGTPMDVHPDVSGDCDDNDDTIRPGAFENWYDGVDSDCDGRNDCDHDGDGYEAAAGICDPDEPDCNDLVDTVNPGAEELCSTVVDDDCDGSVEAEDGPDCTVFYADYDGDGFGIDDDTRCGCSPSFPYSAELGGDCNDFEAAINPGAFDVPYDGLDTDCGGGDDYDRDGDGFASADYASEYTGELAATDCDDDDDSIKPDAAEVCDGVDNDCDGTVDEPTADSLTLYPDADGDGYGDEAFPITGCESHGYVLDSTDCDDSESTTHPGALDYCGDGIDADCSGGADASDVADGCIDIDPAEAVGALDCSGMGVIAPEAAVIESAHFSIHYGESGNWINDYIAAGLRIRPGDGEGPLGSFAETVYAGTRWDFLVVDAPLYEPYEIGHIMGLDPPPTVLCAAAVRMGDVIGFVQTMEIALTSAVGGPDAIVVLTRKELWNEGDQSLLMEFAVEPEAEAGAMDITLQRIVDFDIDAATPPDDDDTVTAFATEGNAVASSGTVSGLSVVLGTCGVDGLVGADFGYSPELAGVADGMCDPDGEIADVETILHADMLGSSAGSPGVHRFVMSLGASVSDALDEWDDEAPELCSGVWDAGGALTPPEESCVGSGPIEPWEDFAEPSAK